MLSPRISFSLAACCLLGSPALAGTFTFTPYTGAQDSGILPGLTYTARGDFAGGGLRVVNGVAFPDAGTVGTGYSLTGAGNEFFNNANNIAAGDMNSLMRDFRFSGDGIGNATLTLTDLVPGQTYVTTWYNVGFGNPGGRNVTITASDSPTSIFFDQNYRGGGNGNVLRYTFVATGNSQTFSFDAAGDNDSFHHYAFTNALASKSLVTAPNVTKSMGTSSPFTVSNSDLLQTNLASVSSSATDFALEGTGGLPVFNNGAFSISGIADNNPELATVQNDAFVQFALDLAANPFGYDITSIETFGGWNDGGRDKQLFKLSYSLVGSEDFIHLGALEEDATGVTGISAIKAVFETELTGVDAIRIDFFGGQESGHTGFGEIDVIGTASVPEPGTAVALLGGLAVLALRRRRG